MFKTPIFILQQHFLLMLSFSFRTSSYKSLNSSNLLNYTGHNSEELKFKSYRNNQINLKGILIPDTLSSLKLMTQYVKSNRSKEENLPPRLNLFVNVFFPRLFKANDPLDRDPFFSERDSLLGGSYTSCRWRRRTRWRGATRGGGAHSVRTGE